MPEGVFIALLAAGLVPARVCAQEGVSVSTAARETVQISTVSAVARAEESPLTLNIEKDRYDSRIGLDYSLRWDFSDLKRFRPDRLLTGGISAVGKWDITENTRVRYYGFSTNPWRLIIAKEKMNGAAPAAGSPITGRSAGPEYKKSLRLSFSPLVDDVRRSLDESLRNLLLESTFNGISPEWHKVPRREKKEFFQDVLSLDIWAVPGLDETKKGLEYISR